MTEYAVSTNLISWVPARSSEKLFGWPQDAPEAEIVEEMSPGDRLVVKFAQNPDYRRHGSQKEYVEHICEVLGTNYDEHLADYQDVVAGGAGAVPFIWRVTENRGDDNRFGGEPWSTVGIEIEQLAHPISTSEFLRLRVTPRELARQFKATAAPGRHVQQIPAGTAASILEIGESADRGPEVLRRLMLVKTAGADEAEQLLTELGYGPDEGDLVFLVTEDSMPGFFEANGQGKLVAAPERELINRTPESLDALFKKAKERSTGKDHFKPMHALASAENLSTFMASDEPVMELSEFAHFHDRFVLLPKRVSIAQEVAARPAPPSGTPIAEAPEDVEEEGGEEVEELELESLHGLTTTALEAQLGEIKLPKAVLAEAVTAIRSGKHLMLSGPPGTGKSRLAEALCRAVKADAFDMATATADWTTFDTIGGYIPKSGGALEFEPGVVLRALQRGNWLVIDELNRADIDKAFGPLFTLLSSSGEPDAAGQDVVLPFRRADKNVRIVWAERREDGRSPFVLTPLWRLIGTMNVRDKATLFQLSFAFLRRFAVVDVPLPDEDEYRDLFAGWLVGVEGESRGQLIDAAMKLAYGPNPLGPAILKDIAGFTTMGTTATDTSSDDAPYEDPINAFLVAVRLYAVAQYEGAASERVDQVLQDLRSVIADPPEATWHALEAAFKGVQLS